jgi:hypothetical protein
MPLYKMLVSFLADSAFPKDRMVVAPYFMDNGLTTDPGNLCTGLNDLFQGAGKVITQAMEVRTQAYEIDTGTGLSGPPKAERTKNKGSQGTSGISRDVALCLSFYATDNVPRKRGRIYVPWGITTFGTAAGTRPSTAHQNLLITLAQGFAALGGVDVDWVVWSPTDGQHRKVTHAFVDDEWDTQRRRGLSPTSRVISAVGS